MEKKEYKKEILTIQEYLDRRKQGRKNEERRCKVLTNFERNVMIHEWNYLMVQRR